MSRFGKLLMFLTACLGVLVLLFRVFLPARRSKVSDLYINTSEYVDLSQAANRAKFHNTPNSQTPACARIYNSLPNAGYDGEAVWLIRIFPLHPEYTIQLGAKEDGTVVWRKLPDGK